MSSSDLPVPQALGHQPVAPDAIQESRGTFACLGSIVRNGAWDLPRRFRALSVLGNLELDLTSVRLGPVSLIEVRAVLGNIEIRVPPNVRLECEGDPFLGSFEVHRAIPSTTSPDAPLVRITAAAYLSSIEVTVVDPNARGVMAKLA